MGSWWQSDMRKARKLEKRRTRSLLFIESQRLAVDEIVQRPRESQDPLNTQDLALLDKMRERLAEIEEAAQKTTIIEKLSELMDDAERQSQFRAYLCPVTDTMHEGKLAFDLIEEWGVPKPAVKKLRDLLGSKLEGTPGVARAALRTLFEEQDSWSDFTDDYEDTMRSYTFWLFGATLVLPSSAFVAFHFASRFPLLLPFGLLFSGVAGSCISVMSKMPALDVGLSNELTAYLRRILSRIGTWQV